PKPRSYAYCSDTRRDSSYLHSIEGADLLYHESTFAHDMIDRAKETFHTIAREAAEIAKEADVSKLLLGHYSARYRNLEPLLAEAKQYFASTELSIEGKWFLVYRFCIFFFIFTFQNFSDLTLSFNLDTLLRDNIKNMEPYSSARDEFKGDATVFMDANENYFGCTISGNYNRYPDPLQFRIKKKVTTT